MKVTTSRQCWTIIARGMNIITKLENSLPRISTFRKYNNQCKTFAEQGGQAEQSEEKFWYEHTTHQFILLPTQGLAHVRTEQPTTAACQYLSPVTFSPHTGIHGYTNSEYSQTIMTCWYYIPMRLALDTGLQRPYLNNRHDNSSTGYS